MKYCTLFLLAAGVVFGNHAYSQSVTSGDEVLESVIESGADKDNEDADFEELLDDLDYLRTNQINLNSATAEELQKLPFLTDFQINSLITYRKEYGNFLSIYELQMVHGFTDDIVSKMIPFVKVTEVTEQKPLKTRNILQYGQHEITLRSQRILEKAAGYTKTDSSTGAACYPGNPWRYYARYRFNYAERIKLGITMEKDPGEDFFKRSNRKGFDYYSASITLQEFGPIKSFIIGDYAVNFGQGLTLWSGADFGISSYPLNIIKRQNPVKPYSGTDENNFFRGMATTIKLGNFILTGFFSSKYRDANISDTMPTGEVMFSAFQESGYHRTAGEIKDEKSVHETAAGTRAEYHGKIIRAGLSFVGYQLDCSLERGDKLYQINNFSGNHLFNAGMDYVATLKKIQFFGETAYGNTTWATLNGLVLTANKNASFSLLYRNYQPDYYALHSAAISENSGNSNEEGFYIGTQLYPVKHWIISSYADLCKFPWLRYRVNAPSTRTDFMVQIDFKPSALVEMYLLYKQKDTQIDENIDSASIQAPVDVCQRNIRYQFTCMLNNQCRLSTRMEYADCKNATKNHDPGLLIYQDVSYKFEKVPVSLYFRYACFDTRSYDSRIYAYEQDISSSFSLTPLYDEGYRTYCMLRYTIAKQITLSFRLAQTRFFNKTILGSGLDEIHSGKKTEIKFQLLAKF